MEDTTTVTPSATERRQLARLRSFYEPRLAEFGDDVRTLDWGSRESQERRFAVLAEVGVQSGQTLLDVGAGLGDLCGWLDRHAPGVRYTGLDLSPALAGRAQARFPLSEFLVGDLRRLDWEDVCDVVVASGIFNVRVPGWRNFFHETVRAMFRASRVAVAFNLLSTAASARNPNDVYCRPETIFALCRTVTPHVVLRHDYMPHDFTMYLYK